MALFFFHFTNGRTIKDEEGENFPHEPTPPKLPPSLRRSRSHRALQFR